MPRNYFDLNINAPLFTELSEEMQQEIELGKRIVGLGKLYGFLENYSS